MVVRTRHSVLLPLFQVGGILIAFLAVLILIGAYTWLWIPAGCLLGLSSVGFATWLRWHKTKPELFRKQVDILP